MPVRHIHLHAQRTRMDATLARCAIINFQIRRSEPNSLQA
jgi:hypothetical protein